MLDKVWDKYVMPAVIATCMAVMVACAPTKGGLSPEYAPVSRLAVAVAVEALLKRGDDEFRAKIYSGSKNIRTFIESEAGTVGSAYDYTLALVSNSRLTPLQQEAVAVLVETAFGQALGVLPAGPVLERVLDPIIKARIVSVLETVERMSAPIA